MAERLTYWRCLECHGTGRRVSGGYDFHCDACDGTGNALVNGKARAHHRAMERIFEATNPPAPRRR